MATSQIAREFISLEERQSPNEYNYDHFSTKHLIEDVKHTFTKQGIELGAIAPDFELPRADGGTLRLSELRGRPVVLHFGSLT